MRATVARAATATVEENGSCERMNKSGTSNKDDHRETAKVVRTWKTDEEHVLRRMLDAPVLEKLGRAEDR